jgi:hypothetical protein
MMMEYSPEYFTANEIPQSVGQALSGPDKLEWQVTAAHQGHDGEMWEMHTHILFIVFGLPRFLSFFEEREGERGEYARKQSKECSRRGHEMGGDDSRGEAGHCATSRRYLRNWASYSIGLFSISGYEHFARL